MKKTLLMALAVCVVASGAPGARKAKPAEGRGQAIDLLAQGQSLEAEGNKTAAFTAYEQSAQLAPSPAAYYNLGRLAAVQGDKAAAKDYLRKALELNPDYQLAKAELARLGGGAESDAQASPTNVDTIQREHQTMTSLVNPVMVAEEAADPQLAQAAVPSAPQRYGAGDAPAVSAAPQVVAPPAGRDALYPQQPVKVVNETAPLVNDNSMGEKTSRAIPAESAPEAAPRSSDEAPAVVPPASQGGAAPTAQGGMPASKKTTVAPSADEVNAAAFGATADGKPEKTSLSYESPTEVVLGTYAFHKDKGDRYGAANRWGDAAMEYYEALKLRPNESGLRAVYAEALARSGEPALAEAQMAKAESFAPNDPKVYYRMGNVYRDQKQQDQAIGAYRRAIDLDPNDKFVHNILGVVYMEKGDYANAVKSFKRVVEIDPAYDKAVLNLGIIYDDNLSDDEQAAKYYERYLDLRGSRAAEVRRWLDAIKKTSVAE